MEDLKTEHFAVIETCKISILGDKRSETNPGHGYPAHTVDNIKYTGFKTEEELFEYVSELGPHAKYRIIKAVPLTLETKYSMSLSE